MIVTIDSFGLTCDTEGDLMSNNSSKQDVPTIIKKYANRRLYNTATSCYVTLEHLCQMVKDGIDFVVYDAKSGDDITRSVLTQIIVEEESKGQNLLPISFLRQLIGLYGNNMQWMVPRYLDMSMSSFSQNQEKMQQVLNDAFGGLFPFSGSLEEMGKQNVAMFERTMKMFTQFSEKEGEGADRPSEAAQSVEQLDQVALLQQQIALLQTQLDKAQQNKAEE